jgi:Tol biopolymer transport system component
VGQAEKHVRTTVSLPQGVRTRAAGAALLLSSVIGTAPAAQSPPPGQELPAPRAALAPGVTVRCSVGADGAQGSGPSFYPSLSADGNCVAFTSSVQNFVPTEQDRDTIVFVHELATGRTDPIEIVVEGRRSSTLMTPALSADGRLVALVATTKGPTGARNIAVFDRLTRAVTCLDPGKHGVRAPVGPYPLALASGGSCLLFQTTADFGRGIDRAGCYLFDLASGAVEPLPCRAAEMWSMYPSVSADGRVIVIEHLPMKNADPRPAGTYVLDRMAGTATAITSGKALALASTSISGDGRFVASTESDEGEAAGDTNGFSDVFVRDLAAATLNRASVPAAGGQADEDSWTDGRNALSADGRFVVFQSDATNLVPGDTNGHTDIFVRDLREGRTVRVSVASDGTQADAASGFPAISAEGRRVAFVSEATNLVPGDTNGADDVFVRELAWPETTEGTDGALTVLFERSHTSDRGFERVREISEQDGVCVLRVDTDYWGGAAGGAIFGWSALSDLCRERGYAYFVILEQHAVRNGTSASPGNEWELTIGLLKDEHQDVAASFPCCADASKSYRAWPLLDESQSTTLPQFMQSAYPSELWEVFSSIHFRFRSPGDSRDEPKDPRALEADADKAERALAATKDDDGRTYALARATQKNLEAGRLEKAEAFALELLERAARDPESGAGGKAFHAGHWVLGCIALQRGDVDAAKARLLKSGMTHGSPTLGSFGPNMRLARDLLQKGETEVVLEYFDLCRVFWELGADELDAWTLDVKAGRIPDFGANLVY